MIWLGVEALRLERRFAPLLGDLPEAFVAGRGETLDSGLSRHTASQRARLAPWSGSLFPARTDRTD